MYKKEIKLCNGLNAGYKYFIDREHPLAYKHTGLVLFHRHVASMKLGRWLTTDEHVHHLDEDKFNNDPSNLEVMSRTEHARLHKALEVEQIELTCLTCNIQFIKPHWYSEQQYCSDKCKSNGQVKDKTLTKELLDNLIPFNSWTELGKMFGYSDNGIKKRAKALGCDISKAKYKHRQVA